MLSIHVQSVPNLLRILIPDVHQYPMAKVGDVQGYVLLMFSVSKIVVASAPHEWMRV